MDAPISSPTTTQHHASTTGSSTTKTQSFVPPPPPPPAQAGKPSTDAFIQDLNLVAEAAKRAQMAVLMRDMEGIALS
ncbi:hypothetical protein DL764_006181 [Monosporascus ibericus]|uniref:Uncharacterized protein n=1 Tax=Monosporascus ibericus TaxID=155417 RepID=A0A4Q4T5T0_9PEZI|nr:hypothetical protein DL764_006181 [Monosporascus ibericus]